MSTVIIILLLVVVWLIGIISTCFITPMFYGLVELITRKKMALPVAPFSFYLFLWPFVILVYLINTFLIIHLFYIKNMVKKLRKVHSDIEKKYGEDS
jgi:hypothetical protein